MKQAMSLNRLCYQAGSSGPLLCWGIGRQEEPQGVYDRIAAMTTRPFRMLAYTAADWRSEFTPWPAPAAFGKEPFAGEGTATLDWLCKAVAQEREPVMLGGYSLSALFSLWAFYESGRFGGAAVCSGSLWYPGWTDYMQAHTAPAGGVLYLSLGRGEAGGRMGTGAAVEAQLLHAQNDANVRECILEWHPGGHFHAAEERMARGFAWLLEHV